MLLGSEKSMNEVHALLLTGGSAFGLAAADGVMQYCEEYAIGYRTPWGTVPIVPAAVIFDLNVGSPRIRPTADSGYRACKAASPDERRGGRIGAGTGTTVGKWRGMAYAMPGGIGFDASQVGDLIVAAIAVVNAIGDIRDDDGTILAGARSLDGQWLARSMSYTEALRAAHPSLTNTTLVAVMTNATLAKVDANRAAQRMHDGFARAIKPVHTTHDGDVSFVLASGQVNAPFEVVAESAADVSAAAIRNAVRPER
jgi:L-aminopeptidase/D-esterase-like protein